MLDIEILQIYGVLVRKRLKDALEEFPVLVSMDPVLISVGLDLLELKPRPWMERKPEKVLPLDPEVANEETLGCSGQVQNPNDIVDLGGSVWAHGT